MALVEFHPEYSAGGTRRGKIRNITFRNIYLLSKYKPKFGFFGYDEGHLVSDANVQNFYLNGKLIKDGDYEIATKDFCANIHIR
jgi:hypothetical protein